MKYLTMTIFFTLVYFLVKAQTIPVITKKPKANIEKPVAKNNSFQNADNYETTKIFNNASIEISESMKRQSRKAMTSGSLTTVPDQSVFVKYLLQILSENNNKYFSSEELFEQLKPIVRNNSDTEPRYGEIKNTHDEGGIFYFIRNDQPTSNDGNHQPNHRNYALLIGVDKYEDTEINSLTESVKNARLMQQVLTAKYTFKEQDVTLLVNPSSDEVQIAFEDLSNKATPNDNVVIFYAGHGYFDEKRNAGYWFLRDARKANTARWFRNSTLVEDIGAIPSKHTLLISDACFSGGIFLTR